MDETRLITLHNDFHNTVARMRVRGTLDNGYHGKFVSLPLTSSQIARARRNLCGIADCNCGNGCDLKSCGPENEYRAYRHGANGYNVSVCSK